MNGDNLVAANSMKPSHVAGSRSYVEEAIRTLGSAKARRTLGSLPLSRTRDHWFGFGHNFTTAFQVILILL